MAKKIQDHPEPREKGFSSKLPSSRLGFWFLVFFVSIWTFVLGILVGRGTAPVNFDIEKLQKELVSLKNAVMKEKKASPEIDPETLYPDSDLGFYEALKHNKNESRLPDIKNPSRANHLPEKPAIAEKKEVPAEKPAEKAEKSPPAPKRETSKPIDKPDTVKNRTIQVASLKDPKTADQMVDRLIRKGYPAYRTIVKIPGKGVWFRIRIGNFKSGSEAEAMLNRLKKENLEAILVSP